MCLLCRLLCYYSFCLALSHAYAYDTMQTLWTACVNGKNSVNGKNKTNHTWMFPIWLGTLIVSITFLLFRLLVCFFLVVFCVELVVSVAVDIAVVLVAVIVLIVLDRFVELAAIFWTPINWFWILLIWLWSVGAGIEFTNGSVWLLCDVAGIETILLLSVPSEGPKLCGNVMDSGNGGVPSLLSIFIMYCRSVGIFASPIFGTLRTGSPLEFGGVVLIEPSG